MLELVVGERSGRRIVGRWAVRVLLPLEGHVRLLQVMAVKPTCRRHTDLVLLAQAKPGEGGDADDLEAHVYVSHRAHAGVGNVTQHASE
jgi:hypothetical protein